MGRKLEPIIHGTTKGYVAHRYRKEDPCGLCRKAWTDYHRELREKGKA